MKERERNAGDLIKEYYKKISGIEDSGIDGLEMIMIRKMVASLYDDDMDRSNSAMRYAYVVGYMVARQKYNDQI